MLKKIKNKKIVDKRKFANVYNVILKDTSKISYKTDKINYYLCIQKQKNSKNATIISKFDQCNKFAQKTL